MRKAIIVLIAITAFAHNGFAWGHKGHSLVVEVAFSQLNETTKTEVMKFLDGKSIEDAANWMDEIRSDHAYDYLKPLHYINIDKGEQFNPSSTGNIYSEINRILTDFKSMDKLKDEEIKLDLLELMHLVGDIHQPLHCGYGSDKGGNTVQVSFFGKGSNIHKVWDSEMIDYKKVTLQDVLKSNQLRSEQIAAIIKVPLSGWVNESRGYLDNCYSFKGNKIDEAYVDANISIVERQLYKAGIRLAGLMELYFGKTNRTPSFAHARVDVKEINVNDASSNIGQTVKVCAMVYGTKELKSGMTFINLGAAYPNSPLTLVIYGDDMSNFKQNPVADEKLTPRSEVATTTPPQQSEVYDDCPPEGNARQERLVELNRLKNRTSFPAQSDFDSSITLAKMLEPGDDRNRWRTDKTAEITAYVADVKVGGIETCNCKARDPEHRDTHIELVINPMNYTNTQKVIVEVTPRMRKLLSAKGEDWSTRTLRDHILGRWVKVRGWMLFDFEHERQAENTNPGNERNWRATSWEIHPLTSMEVVNRPK